MHILFNFIWEASVAVIDLVQNFSGCAVRCCTVPLQALWAVLIRGLWVSTMGLSTFHIAAMATLSPSPNVLLIEWHLIRPWNTTPKLTKWAKQRKKTCKPASQPTLGLVFKMWTAALFKVAKKKWYCSHMMTQSLVMFIYRQKKTCSQTFWCAAAPIRKSFMHNSWKSCLCWKWIVYTCLLLLISTEIDLFGHLRTPAMNRHMVRHWVSCRPAVKCHEGNRSAYLALRHDHRVTFPLTLMNLLFFLHLFVFWASTDHHIICTPFLHLHFLLSLHCDGPFCKINSGDVPPWAQKQSGRPLCTSVMCTAEINEILKATLHAPTWRTDTGQIGSYIGHYF